MAPNVLLAGIPGAGKTSAAIGLCDALAERARPHALIESEWLAQAEPPVPHAELVRHLAALAATMRVGERQLVVTATPESLSELEAVAGAVGEGLVIVWLDVSPAEAERRLRRREPVEWAARLIAKGREIPADALGAAAGVRIGTEGRSESDVVEAVLALIT